MIAGILTSSGARLVYNTPSFVSYGLYKQGLTDTTSSADSHRATPEDKYSLILTRSMCQPWLYDFFLKMGIQVYTRLITAAKDYVKKMANNNQSAPQFLLDIIAGGLEGRSQFMPKPAPDSESYFVKVLPDAQVYTKNGQYLTQEIVENLFKGGNAPKHGIYRARIIPQFVFIGQHGTAKAVSINYQIDQLLYQPAKIQNAPTQLMIDSNFFCEASSSTQAIETVVNDEDGDGTVGLPQELMEIFNTTPPPPPSTDTAEPEKKKRKRRSLKQTTANPQN